MTNIIEKQVAGDHGSVDKNKLMAEGVLTDASSSSELEYTPTDEHEDRRLTNKVDLKVIPILGFLYLICFLDRTNIANARIAGLEKGLNMPPTGFNTAIWIFYIPFVLAEIPLNMAMSLPWIRPDYFLGAQAFILGILAMCQGLTHSYAGLLVVRFLMGIVETGLPAGAGFIIVSYYRKRELSLRFALFFAFGQSGACFSGLLAYALQGMDGLGGYAGWRWIFIIEGLITIIFSICVFIWMPHFPAREKGFTDRERALLLARLEADKGKEKDPNQDVSWLKIALDYKIWLLTALFFCADMSAASLSNFNPSILRDLGWQARRAQVMTIPVWVVGIVGALISTLVSGRFNIRWPFILPAILISMTGWVLHVTFQRPGVRYFAQHIISLGTFIQMPLYIGMLSANLRGKRSQGYGTAFLLGIGNCANFIPANVFITRQAPRYPAGFATGLAITAIAFPIMLITMAVFSIHNRRLKKKLAAGEQVDDQVYYKLVY